MNIERLMAKRKPRRSPKGPGYTIGQFARLPEVNQTESVIRRAVKDGWIAHMEFNGVIRIPPSEYERWRRVWGVQQTSGGQQ